MGQQFYHDLNESPHTQSDDQSSSRLRNFYYVTVLILLFHVSVITLCSRSRLSELKQQVKELQFKLVFPFFCCPQIMAKSPFFLLADMNSPSASSCLRRRWSPPLRGNMAASVTGWKWSFTGRGPLSRRSRRSSQSSSPSTSTHQLSWCESLHHISWFFWGVFWGIWLIWFHLFPGATGWNEGQDGTGMVPQLWTSVCNCKDRPQRLHTR